MGWIATFLKFLPFILQMSAVLFGGQAFKSYSEVTALASTDGALFVGGQGLVATISAFLAHWATIKQSDWGTRPVQPTQLAGGIGGLIEFVQLLFEGFTILSRDSAWSAKFKKLLGFDVPTTLQDTATVIRSVQSQLRPQIIKSE